ncbi:MAG: hypothetical protein KUG78_21955 [Kangiellaceae bacterium]|nr:hypothetical protein [Kangiellaceae bacterium]
MNRLVRNMKMIGTIGLLIFAFGSQASDLTIPNQFTSGARAVAADVNANFDAAATAVSDNQTQITDLIAQIAVLSSSLNALTASISELETSNTSLQAEVDALTADSVVGLATVLTVGTDNQGNAAAIFSGVNLHINNGEGAVDNGDPFTINGLGNLVIGYDEQTSIRGASCSLGIHPTQEICENNNEIWSETHKSGSHNIVLGPYHNYSRYAGLITGKANVVAGDYSIVGGISNTANNQFTTVIGGEGNTVQGLAGSAFGGAFNSVYGDKNSTLGGTENTVYGQYSTITGGRENFVEGESSSISGGLNNRADAAYVSVSGGRNNVASGDGSSISGGNGGIADGTDSSISGGFVREVSDDFDWAAGSLFEDN